MPPVSAIALVASTRLGWDLTPQAASEAPVPAPQGRGVLLEQLAPEGEERVQGLPAAPQLVFG